MKDTDKLIEAFGELAYVVAMADGEVQQVEVDALKKKLAGHKWGEDIQWSFDYEMRKQNDVEDLYKKVMTYCEMHGPDPEYKFLLEMLDDVAKAHNGIEQEEEGTINDFTQELLDKFRNDISIINRDV